MTRWQYCKLYAASGNEDSDRKTLEWEILVNNMGAEDQKDSSLLFRGATSGNQYFLRAGTEAGSALDTYVGRLGLVSWELVSIYYESVFYHNSLYTRYLPAYYFKRPVE